MSLPNEKIKVGIVDDNKAIIASLTENLNYGNNTRVVFSANDGNVLLEQLKTCSAEEFPDVIITDVNMPGMSGIEVVRHGKALYPKLKFLMLTVSDDEDTLFDAIQAGASGYLMKDERMSVIIEHVRRLMSVGSVPMSPRIARKTLDLLARSDKTHQTDNTPAEVFNLSKRELEVLNLLVDGLDYKAIAADLEISPNTVRKHISNIYEKLHVSSKAQAIRMMQGASLDVEKNVASKCNIILTDDHQIILDSLEMMISTIPGMKVIAKLNDSRTVLPYLAEHKADLLISDVSMPFLNGIQLADRVHTDFPEIKILMLTVSEDIEQVMQARAVGAHGYVLKKTGKDELTKAIRTVMKGDLYYSDSLLTP